MKTTTRRDEPAERPEPSPQRGAPATYAAHAVRKNLSVRVRVTPAASDADELREEGYGHGV